MPLPAGTKLGPYEIQSPVGEGGMGEVYRARDARLNREARIRAVRTRKLIRLSLLSGVSQARSR